MTFSSHVLCQGKEQGEKDGGMWGKTTDIQADRMRERGVQKDRERGRMRRREKRERKRCCGIFSSPLAPGTYIKMLILVFFVSFYNSLHFVPLSALFLCLLFLHFSLALHFLCTVMGSPQISALGKRISTLILWYFRWLGSEIGQKCTEFGAIRGILCRALRDWLVELPSTFPHCYINTQPAVVYLWGLTFVLCLCV